MKKILSLFFFLYVGMIFSQNFKIAEFTTEDYLSDLARLEHLIQKQHPNPYKFISKKKQENRKEQAIEQLKENPSFPKFLQSLDRFGDGHLSYTPPEEEFFDYIKENYTFFPFPVIVREGRMFINIKGDELPYGTELISIQKKPIKELMKVLNAHIHGDGYSMTYTETEISESFPMSYATLINNQEKEFEIEYLIKDSNTLKKVILKAIDYYELFRKEKWAVYPINILETWNQIDSRYYQNKKTGVLTVNSFDLSEPYAYKQFSKFFKKAKKDKFNSVIIDLRANGGGDPNMAALLFSFLIDENFKNEFNYKVSTIKVEKENLLDDSGNQAGDDLVSNYENFLYQRFDKIESHYIGNERLKEGLLESFPPDKDNYNGEVFLIVGGNTFSAAVYFAKLFKDNKRGEIIGLETGGNENNTFGGYFLNYKLPKTRLKVRIPLTELYFGTQNESNHGIRPDIVVPIDKSIDYIRKEKDVEIEYLFNMYIK